MNYKFYAHGKCTYVGTIEAESEEEALKIAENNLSLLNFVDENDDIIDCFTPEEYGDIADVDIY